MTGMFDDVEMRPDYDPPEFQRIYYRRASDGQLGWLVVRGGKDKVKLDRPMEDLCVSFDPNAWIPEVEHRPITRFQAAQVAYEADQKLCMLFGDFTVRKDWRNQHEDYRIAWSENGPPAKPVVRKVLFQAIMQSLERVMK